MLLLNIPNEKIIAMNFGNRNLKKRAVVRYLVKGRSNANTTIDIVMYSTILENK